MKNLLLLGLVSSLALLSCSDDDTVVQTPETPNPTPVAEPVAKLVTASNTTGKISYTNLLNTSATTLSFSVDGMDNDGIFYNNETDEIILASRTNNRIETYSGLNNAIMSGMDNLSMTHTSSNMHFTNPREIAVSGDKIIVTQDQAASNGDTNKLFVYQKSSSGYALIGDYTLDFKVWGIHMEGNDLFAIVDLTSDIVVFNNFFSMADGMIMPSKRVSIEGLVRTHGITHSIEDNVMILTDVASASDATDGGIVIISNFSSVFAATSNMGTIAMSNQKRIYGPNTALGNPVDVAYDHETNLIYVAERANGGGKVLTFDMPMLSGDIAPAFSRDEAGVASVFLHRE